MGLILFPVGLVIPLYFFIKASRDEPPDQGTLEVATVIVWGILGMIAVELGREEGAKALSALFVSMIVLFFLFILFAQHNHVSAYPTRLRPVP